MATKNEVHLSQIEFNRLDEMDEAVHQAIGFMELVLKDINERYEQDGTEYEKVTASGIASLHHATRERLEKAVEDLYESAQQNSHLPRKASPKKGKR